MSKRLPIDGAHLKAPMSKDDIGSNPTDRGKNGPKRHLLVGARGVPLAIVVGGANRHDVAKLADVLDGRSSHRRRNGKAGNIGAPMPDLSGQITGQTSLITATFPTSDRAAKQSEKRTKIWHTSPTNGLSKSRTHGSTASKNSRDVSIKKPETSSRSITSPPASSPCAKSSSMIDQILFTDNFLVSKLAGCHVIAAKRSTLTVAPATTSRSSGSTCVSGCA